MNQLSQIYPFTLLIVTCFTIFSGCSSISYYHQAATGHLSLMMATEPVTDWLAAPDTPAPLKQKLQLSQQARRFARDQLKLPVGDAFTQYTELERPWVLVNLVAVPEFSLDPNQWCYPFIGCQAYRGYYAIEDARAEAEKFANQGYDIFIGGVTAYSTLGWFDDPLHTGFTRLSDARMVALMFHELAHQVVYIPEDTAFNESFATAVELEGLRLWLEKQGDTTGFEQALQRLNQRNQTLALVEQIAEQLRQLYEQAERLTDAEMRQRKADLFSQLREDYLELAAKWQEPGPFGETPGALNNANLALFRQYNQHVPAFRQLFRDSARQFDDFYQAVETLSALGPEQRDRRLKALNQRFDENL
ncbi:aminopeptidase [Marinobacter confluentis]|uniref:Zinc protease n=1 Tax=Marinobacter confluentis TaxID=1697557 RepID=A0A4Z1C161_9GAMM|nr:aminopeptidase [Marinobacter confluentis]TGN38722.1 zinc protease [Marinobacter confluentis]